MDRAPRICIIGPGAVGGVVAALLTREAYHCQLVAKYPDLTQKISSQGIQVKGVCGNFTIQVPSVARPDELSGRFDYVLIATKADGLVEAAREVLPFLHENSRVISMQNGICEEMLAAIVGAQRTIGCVVGFGATMHEPGKVEMTSGGELIIGNWNREPDKEVEQLAVILNHVVETRITGEVFQELYSKLIINSCITTLGVVCGQTLGEMLVKRKARNLFIEVIREAVAVADAMEIKVPPGAAGKLDYYKFLAHGPLSGLKRHLTIRVIGIKYRKLKSSSLQSLERGRKTEVDNYNGYITAKGKELNVNTPVNVQLTHMVREIEQGRRQIIPENFKEISYK
ncbi:MAG: 2-dehydropantoate 2-reductase [Bacteroidota bacterium]|nr:2-dehydropantoate 2-reductase [Bacteroidota bacterium]